MKFGTTIVKNYVISCFIILALSSYLVLSRKNLCDWMTSPKLEMLCSKGPQNNQISRTPKNYDLKTKLKNISVYSQPLLQW